MKKNKLKKMKRTNPNIFKESWRERQIRLIQEEQWRLDKATVRKGSFDWVKGEVIN